MISLKAPAYWKRSIKLVMVLTALFLWVPGDLPADNTATPEQRIKASFLYNFALFVEWPEEVFAGPDGPLVIGILGSHSFGNAFEGFKGKTIRKRPVIFRQMSNISDTGGCHVLFVSASEKMRQPEILAAAKKRPILTVSDLDGFYKVGGIINFISLENKVRFNINMKTARLANLKISSQLLKLAHDVITE